MSTSYTATVVYGYPFSEDDLTTCKRNPMWGKHNYNPKTGEEVTEFIVTRIDLDIVLRSSGKTPLHLYSTGYGCHQVVGSELCEEIDLSNGDTEPRLVTSLPEGDIEECAVWVEGLCKQLGLLFDPDKMGTYLVGYVG